MCGVFQTTIRTRSSPVTTFFASVGPIAQQHLTDYAQQLFRLRQTPHPNGSTRLPTLARSDDRKTIRLELLEIALCRGLVPHDLVHGRRENDCLLAEVHRRGDQ